ncbi:DUF4397 domain-containing protein [Shewanella sp. KT0246]|uniref:DUF4397 domain-containing protein n=1 Tax=Shewanella sp. KT0246 TaxID=2815912 RepID=UPI001BB95721|nr:DUF4397 domain-containing protein [Shewanella sp. KT0246]GIU54112.1 hypothetical protein TUM4249_37530 [Shewanella sp. KT0246]
MKKILSATLFVGISLTLAACDWETILLEESSDSSSMGYYQFVNLVAQSPAIEIMVEDESIGELAFGDASTIEQVSNDSYDLEFNQILPNSTNDEFTSSDSISVSKNKTSTYIIYGDTDAPSSLTLTTDISDLYDEDFDEDYDAIIQFINLSSSATDIDVYWLNEGEDLLNKVADHTLAYEASSDEIEIESGVYKLVLTESGTDLIIASTDSITIADGDAQIFALTSYLIAGSDDHVNTIVDIETDGGRKLTNEAQAANVRFFHGISAPDYLDVYLDIYLTDASNDDEASLITSALEFGTLSDSVDIEIENIDTGDTRNYYLMDNTTEDKIDTFSVDMQPGSRTLILTSGDTSSAITVNDNEEDLRVIDTHAKILVSHNISDIKSDAIDVLILNDGANPDSYSAQIELSYMGNDDYELESGDYDIYIYNASTDELIIETSLRGIEKGDVINLIATDYTYGGTPYELQTHINN